MMFFPAVGKHRRSEVGNNMISFVEKNTPGRAWGVKKWGRGPISWEAVPVGQESDYGYSTGDNGREKWFQKNLFFRSILHTFGWLGWEEFDKGRFKDYLRLLTFASSPV